MHYKNLLQKTWNEAHKECYKYELKLLSVESQEEINCLHIAFKSKNQMSDSRTNVQPNKNFRLILWTSGLFWTGASMK
jgi:hypothetical protein